MSLDQLRGGGHEATYTVIGLGKERVAHEFNIRILHKLREIGIKESLFNLRTVPSRYELAGM